MKMLALQKRIRDVLYLKRRIKTEDWFFLLKLIYKKKLQLSQVQARSSMSSLCIVRIRIICRSDKGVLQAAPQIAYNLLSEEMKKKNGNTYIYLYHNHGSESIKKNINSYVCPLLLSCYFHISLWNYRHFSFRLCILKMIFKIYAYAPRGPWLVNKGIFIVILNIFISMHWILMQV